MNEEVETKLEELRREFEVSIKELETKQFMANREIKIQVEQLRKEFAVATASWDVYKEKKRLEIQSRDVYKEKQRLGIQELRQKLDGIK